MPQRKRSKRSLESISQLETAEIRKLRRELEHAKREKKSEELRANELQNLLDDHYASNFTIAKQVARRRRPKGAYVRVFFTDTHGASLDQAAWAAFLEDMRILRPDEIIHGGDVLDCDGWLASHHTTNYVAQTDYTYADEIEAGNQMFDQLQAVCPKARVHVIEGNHDLRVETWALTTTAKTRADAELLINAFAPKNVLHIEKRGFHWYSRGDCHHDSVAGGTIKLGKCYFTHPSSSSKHSAAKMVESFCANVVFGHTHRADYFPSSNIRGEQWGAWNPGCMCVKRKYWHHTSNFKHTQGYHVQLVNADETFMAFNVEIDNGRSYLSMLLDR